jgi:hypothetical protein
MKRALQIYHIVNLMHIVFYVYIVVRTLNIGNARALIQGNALYIFIAYALALILLNRYAKKLGDGFENPMKTLQWPRILHACSIAVFVLTFIFLLREGNLFLFGMCTSFILDTLAFILCVRNAVAKESRTDVLDDLDESSAD